jgi:Fe/S biogenesis protein NfuA
MSSVTTELPIITVTEAARQVVLEMRAAEAGSGDLALRVDVNGVAESGKEFAYELQFEPVADAREGDELHQSGELPVLIPYASVSQLRGAILDHTEATGLLIRNPNRPQPRQAELSGTVEERIQQLLDGEINPGLAAHGGYARLERLEGDKAYVVMGGGCQGCGLAAMTLSEGIKATIEERIPEIREVVDVTDHASGENPFYD